ncbi:MAG TPA: hypothetical protein DIU07_03045 [Rhodobacteraceae bacterium]|nr:hypothetical protein [Paracoccaceae bacterium]
MIVDRDLYRKAFEAYIRKGTPIEGSIKQERPTTHYIWRTRGDSKVRPSHAANDGTVFAWDDPPATGHPGEDFGCRCRAEPYVPETDPLATIRIRNEYLIAGPFRRWGPWVEIFDLTESREGRGVDGLTVTHRIDAEFNRRGDGPEATFDVEIVGLGQRQLVVGPGSTSITHSYRLSGRDELMPSPDIAFESVLRARARSHGVTQNIDARVSFR